MATWVFTNDYLETLVNVDLDNSGVVGDGTDNNETLPVELNSGIQLNSVTYTAGDDYVYAGSIANVALLTSAQQAFAQYWCRD